MNSGLQIPITQQLWKAVFLGNCGKQPQSDEEDKSRARMETQVGHFDHFIYPSEDRNSETMFQEVKVH
jgi:hypothetical protein